MQCFFLISNKQAALLCLLVFRIFSVNVSSKFSSSSVNSLQTSNKIVTIREKSHTTLPTIATGLLYKAALEVSMEPDVCLDFVCPVELSELLKITPSSKPSISPTSLRCLLRLTSPLWI